MEDVADLVVTPFRDIVEKGRTAVENGGENQPMLKAAQSLVKEGERALKRIEPLCKKHLEEYGTSFLVALKENDDIANYRSELNDLLWEFDDYVQQDDFDAEKFAELQALSRKAAPRIYDILMRLKLKAPQKNEFVPMPMQLTTPASPAHSFPPPLSPPPTSPPPLPPITPRTSVRIQSKRSSLAAETRSATKPSSVKEATDQLRKMMQSKSGPDDGLVVDHQEPEPVSEPPPRPPSANPWDVKTPPPADKGRFHEDFAFERRAPVAPVESPVESASPTSPQAVKRLSGAVPHSLRTSTDRVPQASKDREGDGSLDPSGLEIATYERTYSIFPGQSPRARSTSGNAFLSPSIPENSVSDGASGVTIINNGTRHSQTSAYSRQTSRPESMDSNPSSVFDHRRADGASITESERRGSTVSAAPTSPTLGNATLSPALSVAQPTPEGLEAVPGNVPEADYGPIPVEMEKETLKSLVNPCAEDCTIGSGSTFYMHNGFCEGAQDVIRGGIGVRKTKKPIGITSAATVARCINCLYELDFKEIELDVNNDDRGNFTKSGVGFRVRFLQKSHIATKRADELLYGCVFCIHQGHTTHPSDATVFFSQKGLFQHLARHPRPLPEVPGFTVVEQPEMPPNLKNNYDVHFKNPSEPHPATEKADEIAVMPTATSKDKARRMYGQRLLFDKTPALELMQGARITGIMWPSQHRGEWAFGWHDGVYASVPTDILRLDAPPPSDVKMGGTSQVRATARWKFNPKEKGKGDWLKFDKGEVIANISWPYPDHWCWSGTNAKGKWGIFPQVFLDTNTLRELSTSGSDRASILSEEKNRSLSVLARFNTRKSSTRPPSVTGSTSSHEREMAVLPTTYMYNRGG